MALGRSLPGRELNSKVAVRVHTKRPAMLHLETETQAIGGATDGDERGRQ